MTRFFVSERSPELEHEFSVEKNIIAEASPVDFGTGPCKVSVYTPTPFLPYFRLCYRVGGRRYQAVPERHSRRLRGRLRLSLAIYNQKDKAKAWSQIFHGLYASPDFCYLN